MSPSKTLPLLLLCLTSPSTALAETAPTEAVSEEPVVTDEVVVVRPDALERRRANLRELFTARATESSTVDDNRNQAARSAREREAAVDTVHRVEGEDPRSSGPAP